MWISLTFAKPKPKSNLLGLVALGNAMIYNMMNRPNSQTATAVLWIQIQIAPHFGVVQDIWLIWEVEVEKLNPEEWISDGFQLADIFSNLLIKNHPFLNKSTWGCCRTTNRCPAPVLLCGWVPELIVLSTAKGTGRKKTLWSNFTNMIQEFQVFQLSQ